MALRKVEELHGGEILERNLMTWDYQIILPEGSVIKKEYLGKLDELGIVEVWIKDSENSANEIVILKSDIEKTVKEKVKGILERHTYQHNKGLSELSNMADNIINTILSEEEVIEKIYDIKQRSADIYEHSICICSLAILTALKLRLKKKVIHDIGVGCLLHDIGLRYTTVQYDNKDISDMSEKDKMEYKKHPVYGYTTVQNETWISEVSKNIILKHHERLDGSGFPLRDSDLPVECKIVAVCDAFDELICGIGCERIKVYQAIEYLKTFKNSKFDGKIVDVFLGFTAVYPAGTYVLTSEGETGVVVRQNKDCKERPVIRIVRDKDGNPVKDEVIKDLMKIYNIFIEKALD